MAKEIEKNKRIGIVKRMFTKNTNPPTWHESLGETLVCLGAFALFVLIIAVLVGGKMDVKGHCIMNDIKLEDVSPGECYGDFGRYNCPIPKNIECDFDVKGVPISYIITRSD